MSRIISLIFILLLSAELSSQTRMASILGDTLDVELLDYRGDIQWMQSVDSVDWTNISGQQAPSIAFVPSVSFNWIRASLFENDCPVYFDKTIRYYAVDTSDLAFQADTFFSDLIGYDLISNQEQHEMGVLMFGGVSGSFDIEPGDYIIGQNSDPFYWIVSAYILNEGILTLYTYPSNVSTSNLNVPLGSVILSNVVGRVMDEQGNPIFNANVSIGNTHVKSDGFGVFIVENAQVNEYMGLAKVSCKGYLPSARSFIPKFGNNELEISLLKDTASSIFQTLNGAYINENGFNFQAYSNVYQLNGQAYSGFVYLVLNYFSANDALAKKKVPGNLFAAVNGTLNLLNLNGLVYVSMKTASGADVSVAPGSPMRLSFPVSEAFLSDADAQMPVWRYDETFGYWRFETMANLQNGKYVAQVFQFGYHMCAVNNPSIRVSGQLTNQIGTGWQNALVTVNNLDLAGFTDVTNYNGYFSGLAPKYADLHLNARFSCGEILDTLTSMTIASSSAGIELGVISVESSQEHNYFKARIVDCNSNPVNSGYVHHSEGIAFLSNAEFSINSCENELVLTPYSWPIMSRNLTSTVALPQAIVDGGDIEFCLHYIQSEDLIDIDGNTYKTVVIGSKTWMAENLRTTKYANGTQIPEITLAQQWQELTTGAWCNYNNATDVEEYNGKLYNWYAASDTSGLCPIGWHIPTYNEFDELRWLFPGSTQGAKKIKAIPIWSNTNNLQNNDAGFTAYPSGIRNFLGAFSLVGTKGHFWSSTLYQYSQAYPFVPILFELQSSIFQNQTLNRASGLSVRCVKD
jgi:uncharacterized protein (TIGR02145 family)